MSYERGGLWVAVAVGGTAFGALLTQTIPQLAVATCLVLFGLALATRTRMLFVACLFAPFIPLVRRLIVQEAGDPPFDPLVLVPLILLLIVVVFSIGQQTSERETLSRTHLGPLIFIGATSAVISVALGGGASPDVVYGLLSVALPIALALGVGTGRIPDVWPMLEKYIVPSALIAGAYGIFQFLALPSWDSAWMVSSELRSIGSPEPFEVRVFGVSESPGPFACFIGLAIVVAVARALRTRSHVQRLLLFAAASVLVIPLVLTGVRTALIAVAACMIVLSLTRGRGLQRLIPVVLLVVGTMGLNRIIGAVSGRSTVLVSDRYGQFNAASDDSVQARLSSLASLLNPFGTLIGSPSGTRADNLLLDVTINYGSVCGFVILVLLTGAVRYAFVNLSHEVAETASASVIFVAVMSLSGNVMLAGFGVIAGAAFGATLRARNDAVAASAEPVAVAPGAAR